MLLWCDGFDHYGSGSTGQGHMVEGPWAQVDAGVTPNATQVRTETYALQFPATTNLVARRAFGSDLTDVGFGLALYMTSVPAVRSVQFELRDNANAAQLVIAIETTGAVSAYRGDPVSGGTLLGTSATLLTAGAWQHLEVKVKIADSGGTVDVRLNGSSILALSALDTKNTGVAGTAQLALRQVSSSAATWYIDDLFAWDTTGSRNNTFIGDKKVYLRLVDGDGSQLDWTPNAGTAHFSRANEVPPDDDTSYVGTPTAGALDRLTLANLPGNVGGIAAVQIVYRAKKTDAGTCDVRSRARSGTSETNGTTRSLTTAYNYYADVYEVDPATSAAWTNAGVNGAVAVLDRVN